MKEPKKLRKARTNLLALRDKAFFDKLQQAYGIIPQDKKKRCSLKKLAKALELVEKEGGNKHEDRFTSIIEQASVRQFNVTSDEETLIRDLASKLGSDAALRESAALLTNGIEKR